MSMEPSTHAAEPIAIPTRWIPSSFNLDGKTVPVLIRRLAHGRVKELRAEFRAATDGKKGQALNDSMTDVALVWIPQFVRVPEGALVDPDNDNKPIVSGQDVVDALSARQDVMMALSMLVISESSLGSAGKKALRSAVGFLTGSQTPSPAVSGDAPAPTVEPAAAPGSIANEAATAPTSPEWSGAAVPLSSDIAPSAT